VQRIGLYGGSFDPIHLGHLLVAQAAAEELRLDRLFFIPTACSPFKQENQTASNALRAAMLRLALVGRTDCEVDEQEFHRGGVSYTVDTARDYAKRFPGAELFWLIGADNVAGLPQWRAPAELARLVQFAVIPRPGEADVAAPEPFRAQQLRGFPFGVSSSQIRARVKARRRVDHLLPPGVAEVIHNNRLYL
jgi:nicotinate-nucleotide adenylyltransferase